MIYLYWYVGIGAGLFGSIFGNHLLTKKSQPDVLLDLLEVTHPARQKLSDRILGNVVVPVVAVSVFIAGWPVAAYMIAKDTFSKKKDAAVEVERTFAVKRTHLLERLGIADIETREVIVDPLKAVPEVPFGHLNPAWCAFIGTLADDDELWSFSATWQTGWSHKERRSGYVIVREGAPGSSFLSLREEIEERA